MLRIEGLRSGYGRIEAIKEIDLTVGEGEIVALIGANGAGKTTLLRAISGVQPIASGRILFEGRAIEGLSAPQRLDLGIAQVPEGRQIFTTLTVEDNLRLGAYRRGRHAMETTLREVYARFPVLAERRASLAGGLSGGQQQMLALGRALMSQPRLLLLDEPSMGLAPMLVDQILEEVVELRRQGVTILLVEQNAFAALAIADRAYVLESGRITHRGTGRELIEDARVREAYLGL